MTPRATRAFAFALLALAAFAARVADAAVTYVKPNWAPVSEWSPAAERSTAAALHSSAMSAYATALDNDPRVKPCVYC